MPQSGRRAVYDPQTGKFSPIGDEVSNTVNMSYMDLLGGFVFNGNYVVYRTFDGTEYRVLGTIHSHPRTVIGNPQLPSNGDKGDNTCKLYGVPQYIIGAEGITEYSDQGSLGVKFTYDQLNQCQSSLF